MRILALDTATEACSAAVLWADAAAPAAESGERRGAVDGTAVESTHLIGRYDEPGRGHAERILGMVDAVLAEARLPLTELDAIAFGRGPGGFTGARLAASVAQGLAYGAGLPVVPVSDLRALAQRALDAAPEAQSILVCADARMREVYWCCFRRGETGLAETIRGEAERVGAPDSVELPGALTGPIHGAGRGFLAYPQLAARLASPQLAASPGARLAAVQGDLLPRAHEIARLAAADFAAGHTVAPQDAIPVYLRDDVARPPS